MGIELRAWDLAALTAGRFRDRRWLTGLALLLCVLLLSPPALAETARAKVKVNLRAAPDLATRIVAVLARDAEVEILDNIGEFVLVRRLRDGRQGYLRRRMLDFQDSGTAATEPGEEVIATATLRINLREKPDKVSRIVAVLEPGVRVAIEETLPDGEYVRVRRLSDGATGHLRRRFLTVVSRPEPETATAPAPEPAPEPEPVAVPEPEAPPVAEVPPGPPEPAPETPAPPIHTQLAPLDHPPRGGWYAFLQGGQSFSGIDAAELERALRAVSPDVEVRDLDDAAAGMSAGLGFRVSPHLRLQGAYHQLGDFDGDIVAGNADPAALARVLERRYPLGGPALSLSAIGDIQLGSWDLEAHIGTLILVDPEIELRLNGSRTTLQGESGSALFGLGAMYRLTRHWSLGIAGQRLELNEEQISAGLVLRYE